MSKSLYIGIKVHSLGLVSNPRFPLVVQVKLELFDFLSTGFIFLQYILIHLISKGSLGMYP